MATKKTYTEAEIKNMLNQNFIFMIKGTQEHEINEIIKRSDVKADAKLATEISLVLTAVEHLEKRHGLWSVDEIAAAMNYYIEKYLKDKDLKTTSKILRTFLVALQNQINKWKAMKFDADAKLWLNDYKVTADILGEMYLRAELGLRMGKKAA